MKLAYADPPYIGQAKKHYGNEESYAGEVDHAQLVERLLGYDGFALSLSTPSLYEILGYFYVGKIQPVPVRIGAWVKPFASFKPGVNPAYAWEPVIFKSARSGKERTLGRKAPTIRDWHAANIMLKKGLAGAKPESFARWIVDLLGAEKGDTIDDLFPGTGICGRIFQSVLNEG